MPQTRMEAAYAANPNIGRVRLQNEAGVSQLEARVFLAVKRNGQPVERSTGTVNELRKQVRELTEKNHELTLAAELFANLTESKLKPPKFAHWHQEIDTNGIIVNNSLKGYDEFAANNNFQFSKPTQAFWLTDPEHGRTLRAPIHVVSKDENWESCVDESETDWLRGAIGE